MKLAIFSAFLLLVSCLAFADEDRESSPADSLRYEQLNEKYVQSFEMSPDEADDAKSQAVEGFDDNLQKSDPETQSAIRQVIDSMRRISDTVADDGETSNED
jgi:phosphomevalonate kinase